MEASKTERAPDIRTLHRYKDLLERKVELDAELKTTAAELEKLLPQALAYFERQGLQSVSLDGRTLFLRRELWPKLVEGCTSVDAVDALAGTDLAELAAPKLNWQKLASVLRERERDGGSAIPNELVGIIEASETWKIGHRAA